MFSDHFNDDSGFFVERTNGAVIRGLECSVHNKAHSKSLDHQGTMCSILLMTIRTTMLTEEVVKMLVMHCKILCANCFTRTDVPLRNCTVKNDDQCCCTKYCQKDAVIVVNLKVRKWCSTNKDAHFSEQFLSGCGFSILNFSSQCAKCSENVFCRLVQ